MGFAVGARVCQVTSGTGILFANIGTLYFADTLR